MSLSDYADWWDQQKRESESFLMEWVGENPQWWAVGIATATQTSMDLGSGFVDVLRFGQGAAEGGWGYGRDALRLLVLLGPLGRAGGIASRFLHTARLRFAVQVNGVTGPCTFQAVNNALSILRGKSLFITLRDMAAALGRPLRSLRTTSSGYDLGAWVDELVPLIARHTRVRQVFQLLNLDEVIQLAGRENGVTIFAIRAVVRNAAGATEELLHTVIAYRRAGGSVAFADYGGKAVGSLAELVTKLGYGTPTAIELYQSGMSAVVLRGMNLTGQLAARLARGAVVLIEGVTAIETNENGIELAVPAALGASPTSVLPETDPSPPEVVRGSFDAYRSRRQGRPVVQMPPLIITAARAVAPRADWLTGVQFRLNALGFGAGPVDGKMGPLTEAAVRRFQRTYPPLRVDGIPGPKTQAKLVEISGY